MEEEKNTEIEFKIDRSVTEGVIDIDSNIFPNHFTALICGWPGNQI
jgi:hypothetical protein